MSSSALAAFGISTDLSRAQQLTSLWQQVVKVPTIRNGVLHPASTTDDDAVQIMSVTFETPDVESNGKLGMENTYVVQGGSDLRVIGRSSVPPSLVDGKLNSTFLSPSKTKKLLVLSGTTSDEVYVTVQRTDGVLKKILVPKSMHGQLLPSPFFQHVTWNKDESLVAYVAEKPVAAVGRLWEAPKSSGSVTGAASPTTPVPGAQSRGLVSAFEGKQSFGETMKDFSQLSIFVLDIAASTIREIVPESFSNLHWLVNPVFVDNTTLWFTAAAYFPEKLGLAHCAVRPVQLYRTSVASLVSSPEKIPYPDGVLCVRNMRCRNGKVVCYVPATGCKAHACAYALWVVDAATLAFRCVVPVVDIPDASGFPGLYSATGSDIVWVSDDAVALQSPRKSACVIYIVTLTDSVVRLAPPCVDTNSFGNWVILDADAYTGRLLLSHSTTLNPPAVVLWAGVHAFVSNAGRGSVVTVDDSSRRLPVMQYVSARFETIIRSLEECHGTEFLLHRPKEACEGESVAATILFVHGGPHASDTNSFTASFVFQLLCGIQQVASVNYGGSVGFGQRRVEELLGNIGKNDVFDCMAALDAVAAKGPVVVSGGSHGGFLAAQLSGQFPDRFQVALLRNPVINLASLFWESDINDWCLAETGVDAPDVVAFYAASPIQYAPKVTAATLIGIGLDDLRVPIPQGRAWYYALRRAQAALPESQRKTVRLVEYPGTGHSMDSPQASADFQVHGILLIEQETTRKGE